MSGGENMEARLKRLERDYALLLRGPGPHDCWLKETGVCTTCEPYWDMREELECEILRTQEELAPIWLHKQSCARRICVGTWFDL